MKYGLLHAIITIILCSHQDFIKQSLSDYSEEHGTTVFSQWKDDNERTLTQCSDKKLHKKLHLISDWSQKYRSTVCF